MRAQESSGKFRKAQESSGELRRAQESSVEPRKAQESSGELSTAQDSSAQLRTAHGSSGHFRTAQESSGKLRNGHVTSKEFSEVQCSSGSPYTRVDLAVTQTALDTKELLRCYTSRGFFRVCFVSLLLGGSAQVSSGKSVKLRRTQISRLLLLQPPACLER